MLKSLFFGVLGSIGISAAATALGAGADTKAALLPVYFMWGLLCGVIFA